MLSHVAVRIPVSVRAGIDQLDETHAPLGEPARNEALPRKTLRASAFKAIKLVDQVSFLAEIESLGSRHLHAVRGLEGADARGELRIVVAGEEVALIERSG